MEGASWKKLLQFLKLIIRIISQDVMIYWNSMFTVLNFALEYHEAKDKFTSDRSTDIWKLELDEEELKVGEAASKCP